MKASTQVVSDRTKSSIKNTKRYIGVLIEDDIELRVGYIDFFNEYKNIDIIIPESLNHFKSIMDKEEVNFVLSDINFNYDNQNLDLFFNELYKNGFKNGIDFITYVKNNYKDVIKILYSGFHERFKKQIDNLPIDVMFFKKKEGFLKSDELIAEIVSYIIDEKSITLLSEIEILPSCNNLISSEIIYLLKRFFRITNPNRYRLASSKHLFKLNVKNFNSNIVFNEMDYFKSENNLLFIADYHKDRITLDSIKVYISDKKLVDLDVDKLLDLDPNDLYKLLLTGKTFEKTIYNIVSAFLCSNIFLNQRGDTSKIFKIVDMLSIEGKIELLKLIIKEYNSEKEIQEQLEFLSELNLPIFINFYIGTVLEIDRDLKFASVKLENYFNRNLVYTERFDLKMLADSAIDTEEIKFEYLIYKIKEGGYSTDIQLIDEKIAVR